MHPVALFLDSARGYQIAAQRIILGQVCREVHLLPLELLSELFFAREAKLAQMPSLDEVKLAIRGGLVDFVRMHFLAYLDGFRVHGNVGFPMPEQKGILFTRKPSQVTRKGQHAVLVKFQSYTERIR